MKRNAAKESKLTKRQKGENIAAAFEVVSFPSLATHGCGKLLDILTQLVTQTKKARPANWSFDPDYFVSHSQDMILCLYPIKSKTNADDPLWDVISPCMASGLFLPGRGNSAFVIIGWAEVHMQYSDPKFAWGLNDFFLFMRGHNFGKRFYRLLLKMFSKKLFVNLCRHGYSTESYWRKLGAARHTQHALPKDFSFGIIGWDVHSKMRRILDLPQMSTTKIMEKLRANSLYPRNRILSILYFALECDFPILEAMSAHWEPCYLNVSTKHGYDFSFSKKRAFKELPKFHWKKQNDKSKLCALEGNWNYERATWFSVLQSCNVRLIGSEFGRISWTD
jgi:hypothetical protein